MFKEVEERHARKYFGMLPFKYFRCGKNGHIATRCLEKGNRQNFKENNGKFNKKAYYVKDDVGISDDESNYEDSDCLFLIEKDFPKYDISKIVANTFHSRRDKNEWLINSGCSNHMTGDKCKFIKLERDVRGSVRLGDDKTT